MRGPPFLELFQCTHIESKAAGYVASLVQNYHFRVKCKHVENYRIVVAHAVFPHGNAECRGQWRPLLLEPTAPCAHHRFTFKFE
jgi:hypothetical protein